MQTLGSIKKVPIPEPSPTLVGFVESDVRARPFKLLRSMLGRELPDEKCNVIGITSPSPHAGKSFIASNLAAAISRIATNNVVLVDLDLQRSSIAEIFNIDEPPGVAEYLLGEVDDFSECLRQVEDTNLTILPALYRSINSAELMAGKRFSELISNVKELGESPIVICDLPPLFVSDDAVLAGRHMDGVIMVIEQGVTTKKQLESSLQLLHPIKLIGTIFNRSTGGFGDPYAYTGSYGAYYK